MTVKETILGRLKKLLRVKVKIDVSAVSGKTQLGGSPIGFDDLFITTEFRLRVNEWFDDLIDPFPQVDWEGKTTLDDLTETIVDGTKIKKAAEYRQHVTAIAETAFDKAAGTGAASVPVEQRPEVRSGLNDDLQELLIRDVILDDLAGDRSVIIGNIVERMLI